MLIEALVFGGDHRVLKIGRDLAERDEFVARVVGSAVSPALKLALHLYRGGWWIDPAAEQKGKRSEQPNRHYANDKALQQGSQEFVLGQNLGGWCLQRFGHISEYRLGWLLESCGVDA
jgi:hypothetical protein